MAVCTGKGVTGGENARKSSSKKQEKILNNCVISCFIESTYKKIILKSLNKQPGAYFKLRIRQ